MNESITKIPGIGPARQKYFNKLKITTVDQLLRLYPRRYEDMSNVVDISDMGFWRAQKITVCARVCSPPVQKRLDGGRTLTSVAAADSSGAVNIYFFNNRFIKNSLHTDRTYYFYGMVSSKGIPTMYNPQIYSVLPENSGFLPVYPLTEGITQNFIRKVIRQALKTADISDPLTPGILKTYGLCGLSDAFFKIHSPGSQRDIDVSRNRFIFEELLYFCLGLGLMKKRERRRASVVIPEKIPDEFEKAHDFSPTPAQARVLKEIYSDLKSGYCMHRLLQGDVGSGKTYVAGQCAYTVIRAGAQAAVMAPTEVLANQHYEYFTKMMAPLGIEVALLTSAIKPSLKQQIKQRIKNGQVQLVIATHAVLQSDVKFYDLGLVITDEQHRFGVLQRTLLAQKGSGAHILVMSATPIPRTLAMILWNDLDLSTINMLPSGRQKTDTYLVDLSYMQRLYKFIGRIISENGQVYYVCPAIEEDEDMGLVSAKEKQAELAKIFGQENVLLLHGRMKPEQKDSVMRDFASGKSKILVSTTVIEVGINVPAAALMIIDGAHRFGLSQLHQLRGRVGRGDLKSYCVLISDTDSDTALERMRFFVKTTDGFEIAKEDLKLRGPGNFFGQQQHGLMKMTIADLANDGMVLQQASQCAKRLLDEDPMLENHLPIRQNIKKLFESCELD